MSQLIENGTLWTLKEVGTDKEHIKQNETLFSLSNGHIGTRGSLEETHRTPEASHSESTLINAFYDTEPITYGEWAYGYATHDQTIIPVPNGKKLEVSLNGETFDLETGKTTNHTRTLYLKKGLLERTFNWESPKGDKIEVKTERFVSYDYPEIIVQRIEVTPEKDKQVVELLTELDDLSEMGHNQTEDSDPRIKKQTERRFESNVIEGTEEHLVHIQTHSSDLHAITGSASSGSEGLELKEETNGQKTWTAETKVNEPIHLTRFIGYSEVYDDVEETQSKAEHLETVFSELKGKTYEEIKTEHIQTMENFWDMSDIEIEGDDELQVGLRFNLFHLHQAAGRDGKRNMSAKGLTGEGYEGHYFWDTEMYMFPFFLYTQPEIAKALLQYRYSVLPQARERARTMAIPNGALFAWRTINGEEASPYYPAGTAQVHINADIAYAVYSYIQATDDKDFANNEGLEILVETARFWKEYGHYDEERQGAFVINEVTGPDEYTAIVNNNFYTNWMAKKNLEYAVQIVSEAQNKEKVSELNLKDEEVEEWEKIAEALFLPYDENRQVTMQDDSFFHKKVWDFDSTPEENYPLLLNYHPLTIYRHQVCKQADTMLAELLFSWEFSQDQKQRDFDYYEAVTTHDSSLSRSVFGMVANDIGENKKAYDYFMDTALMDITDMQSNTKDGVHAANMGGTWMSMIYGFAGMQVYDGHLHFSPTLPEKWKKVAFTIQFKNRVIKVHLTKEGNRYELLKGESLTILENDEEITVA